MGLGVLCTIWYFLNPEILTDKSGWYIPFLILNFSIIPFAVYLGYLGENLPMVLPIKTITLQLTWILQTLLKNLLNSIMLLENPFLFYAQKYSDSHYLKVH
jgi:hypothetical protein